MLADGTGRPGNLPGVTIAAETSERRTRVLRRVRLGIYIAAISVSFLAVLLVLAAWRNDHTITSDMGVANAEVLSAGRLRSAVSFMTPDGKTVNPKLGILYPTNLTKEQQKELEKKQQQGGG